MELTSKQVRYLRSLAHALNPLVQMGKNGYGDTLVQETVRGLADHELIKVRLSADDRTEFDEMCEKLAADTDATLVQSIGRIAVLYRQGEEPEIVLP